MATRKDIKRILRRYVAVIANLKQKVLSQGLRSFFVT